MRHFISLGMIMLLTSCAATTNYYPQTVQSWRGKSVQKLTHQWGRPDQMMTNQSGNTYFIYKTSSYRASMTPGSPNVGVNINQSGKPVVVSQPSSLGNGARSLSLDCVAIFEVNKNKTIVGTQYQGNGCYGSQSFAKRMSNHP
jgi:hypothetical protein